MLKFFIFLFLTLHLFLGNISANEINKKTTSYEDKYYEEKFLILNRDIIERDYRIDELKKEIKDLEDKFNQNNIDKKSIEKNFENNKQIIERQDNRIDDIHANLNYWGIGFSLIAIFTGIAVFLVNRSYANSAKKEAKVSAEKELKKWIDVKADKEFNSLVEQAKKEIESNVTNAIDEIKMEYVNTFINKLQDNGKDLNKDNKYSELIKLVIQKYQEEGIAKSFEDLEKAINCAETEKEKVQSLFIKALFLGRNSENIEPAITVYDEISNKFINSSDNIILEQVAKALMNKATLVKKIKGNDVALAEYDKIISKFCDSKDNNILNIVNEATSIKEQILNDEE